MTASRLYISHSSALYYWRTNPPVYVLEGADRDIRSLRGCPTTDREVKDFHLSEAEFGPFPVDVMVPPNAPRPRSILRYHIQKAPLPAHSLYPLRDGILLASPGLCYVQMCKSLSFADALALGMELCGTFALRPDEPFWDEAKRNYQLLSAVSLKRKVNAWKDVHGLQMARKAAAHLADGSASPMESAVYLLLCLPQQYGGYHLEAPELNAQIELAREDQNLLRQLTVKPDLLWRKRKHIVEYDGEYHEDPAQLAKDARRKLVLESMGYTVQTVRRQSVYDPVAFDKFAQTLAKRLGKRVRPLSAKQQYAREELRAALLPKRKTDTRYRPPLMDEGDASFGFDVPDYEALT